MSLSINTHIPIEEILQLMLISTQSEALDAHDIADIYTQNNLGTLFITDTWLTPTSTYILDVLIHSGYMQPICARTDVDLLSFSSHPGPELEAIQQHPSGGSSIRAGERCPPPGTALRRSVMKRKVQ